MSVWTIEQLVAATGGQLVHRGTRPLNGVGTDTRGDLRDKIFVPLKGEKFDAHEFAGQACQQGASAVLVHRDTLPLPPEVTVIRVTDTLEALTKFAHWHRTQWKGKLVGLTGSNGKTTTKEFCQTVLSKKYPVLVTEGNLNNHIGVPLTLLRLRTEHRLAVIEMGMNHSGEIAQLCKIAEPDVVLVTNVGRAHIEHFGSIEAIAKAKEEIYENAPLKATRIYNMDNPQTVMMRVRAPGGCRVLTFSSYERNVDVSLREKLFTIDYIEVQGLIAGEPGSVKIPSYGRQIVENAMAAAAIGLACDIDAPTIWSALKNCKSGWGRNQIVELENGARVLFDAYNANPDSAAMAIENFSKLAVRGRKFVAFADMLELGADSAKMHQEVGAKIAHLAPEAVLLYGQQARAVENGLRIAGFAKTIVVSDGYDEALARQLGSMLQAGDVVLVKGSRGMKMERMVQLWAPHSLERH